MTIMESIPTDALPQEPAPRKRPGRKPAIDPLTGERLHKPRPSGNRKRTTTRRAAPRKARSLREPIAALLTMANSIVLMSPLGTRPIAATMDPSVPVERLGDELDAAEIAALAASIDMQCQRSPRFRKYVESMLSVGSGGALITTLGMIAARRAARHGLAPAALDPMLGIALAGDNLDALLTMDPPEPAPDTTPDPVTGERPPMPLDYDGIGAMEP